MEHSCAHITRVAICAHTHLLGPILGQLDLRSQLYIRNFRFYGTRLDLTTILYILV